MQETSDFFEMLVRDHAEGLQPGEEDALRTVFAALNAALTLDDPQKLNLAELGDLLEDSGSIDSSHPRNPEFQSDRTLKQQLISSIGVSASLVEKLQRHAGQLPADVKSDPLCQLELQLIAAGINAEALLAQSATVSKPSNGWGRRIQTLLLYEFNFVNNLICPKQADKN